MVPTRPSPTCSFDLWTASRFKPSVAIEFEHLARPHHIDGAHLGHHVGGDQHDDLVEPLLRCLRLRHHLAEPPEQDTRAKGGSEPSGGVLAHACRAAAFQRPLHTWTMVMACAVMGSVRRLQSIGGVQGPHGKFRIGLVDQHADLDFRCRDRLDVDALVGQRP